MGNAPILPFAAIAGAALNRAESLVAQWLPDGERRGPEWIATNPLRADAHKGSFAINLTSGAWGDFATSDRGGDLVSLYAYLYHGDNQGKAARELAALLGIPMPGDNHIPRAQGQAGTPAGPVTNASPAVPEAAPKKKPGEDWTILTPVPADAPAVPAAHEHRGIPEMRWEYRDADGRLLGYIDRYRNSHGGKEIIPWTYCRHLKGFARWKNQQWPEPRPLYGLDQLAARPDATVLIVEGEKCKEAAQAELPDLVVISWPGGGKAVHKADWSPLAGRRVITWADADAQRQKLTKAEKDGGADPESKPLLPFKEQPGYKAMAEIREKLAPLGCKLWDIGLNLAVPLHAPSGWDVADAIAEGLCGEALAGWIRLHACRVEGPADALPPETEAGAGGGGDAPPPPDDGESGPPPGPGSWRDDIKYVKKHIADCLSNVYLILCNDQAWEGVLGFNEFSLRVEKLRPPPYPGAEIGDWTDVDDSLTNIWLTQRYSMMTSSGRVGEAVETVARGNRFHPVRDWLDGLPAWDGIERLDHWLTDCLGVADSEYVRRVARFFIIGMIARIYRPGCKMDNCLVLEGTQGKGKSTALKILGGDWFDDTDINLESKDAMASLQGVWLHEFAELGSLAKAEASKQKSFLSRGEDKYRPPYGTRDIRAKRQTVFGGSVNDWEWQKDPTGGRRFWPVECADELNLSLLIENRPAIFAEALAAFKAGERWYPTPEEQKRLFDPEQLQREAPNNYVDALHDWVYEQTTDFPMSLAIMKGLGLDASKMTTALNTTVGIALRKLGCTRVEKRNGMVRYWYRPPNWKEPFTGVATVSEEESENVPF